MNRKMSSNVGNVVSMERVPSDRLPAGVEAKNIGSFFEPPSDPKNDMLHEVPEAPSDNPHSDAKSESEDGQPSDEESKKASS